MVCWLSGLATTPSVHPSYYLVRAERSRAELCSRLTKKAVKLTATDVHHFRPAGFIHLYIDLIYECTVVAGPHGWSRESLGLTGGDAATCSNGMTQCASAPLSFIVCLLLLCVGRGSVYICIFTIGVNNVGRHHD